MQMAPSTTRLGSRPHASARPECVKRSARTSIAGGEEYVRQHGRPAVFDDPGRLARAAQLLKLGRARVEAERARRESTPVDQDPMQTT
jgi:hypothetical protein